MKVYRLLEGATDKCPNCNRDLVEGKCPDCDKTLNEGPLSLLKNVGRKLLGQDKETRQDKAEMDAAKSILKKEEGNEGKQWDYYDSNGKKLSYDAYMEKSDDDRLQCIVVDSKGYFVRKGTEVLLGKRQTAEKVRIGGDLSDDSKKIKDSHKGSTLNVKGKPSEWIFTYKEGETKAGHELIDDDGNWNVDWDNLESVADANGNEIPKETARKLEQRYNARRAERAEQKDKKASAEKASVHGDKKVQKVQFTQYKGTDKQTTWKNTKEFKKAYKNMLRDQRKALTITVQYTDGSTVDISHAKAVQIPALKKAYGLQESVNIRKIDDEFTLNESYCVVKPRMRYDDDFEGEPVDLEYEINTNVDDDFC